MKKLVKNVRKNLVNVIAVIFLLLSTITPVTNIGAKGLAVNEQPEIAGKGEKPANSDPAPTPEEYLPYLAPATALLSLSAPISLTTLYDTDAEKAMPTGIYRATVGVRGVADLEKLRGLSVPILGATANTATVLVNRLQLEDLAYKGFFPRNIDLVSGLRDKAGSPLSVIANPSEILDLDAPDTDNDGLNDTEEVYWCTNPAAADSDNDTVQDGAEVNSLRDWVRHERVTRPASGKPFAGWPTNHQGCYDSDYDSVPDAVEVYVFGLNPNRESTPRDKFDDGQKLFGLTNCPGGSGCGYGALPRLVDWNGGLIFAEMPSWVRAPYDGPFVAAFPGPEVEVVPSSLVVTARTTIQTERTIQNGEAHTYGTTETKGTSSSVADTTTWNNWQEVSVTTPQGGSLLNRTFNISREGEGTTPTNPGVSIAGVLLPYAFEKVADCELEFLAGSNDTLCHRLYNNLPEIKGSAADAIKSIGGGDNANMWQKALNYGKCLATPVGQLQCGASFLMKFHQNLYIRNKANAEKNQGQNEGVSQALIDSDGNNLRVQPVFNISYPAPVTPPTTTETQGRSWGGAQTTTHTEYQEHSVSQSSTKQFSEAWSNATAQDTAWAANLTFTYRISNKGSDYAREIGDMAFNIYIGDDPNPIYTYFPASDIGGDGKFHNFMPGETHVYASRAIPLSLDQLKAVDLGTDIFVVVEDFSYGVDELFYQDAFNSGGTFIVDSGDGVLHSYLLPTWGEETLLEVVRRFFPTTPDRNNSIVTLSVPDYATQTPTWRSHSLAGNAWWNIYMNIGDGELSFEQTPASSNSTILIRMNVDTDLDGYNDRDERALGTNPNDSASHPTPQLIAATHSVRAGNVVTSTMTFLNTGNYDAYGIEARMYAPDSTTTIEDNTVGGGGRVRGGQQAVLGNRIFPPSLTGWHGGAKPFTTGSYTGNTDKVFTFTAGNPGNISSGTLNVNWSDGAGNSGTLNFGSGYQSPTPLNVRDGLKVGFNTGSVNAGDVFTVAVQLPRDTFSYTINTSPVITPVIIVSYNDPQGNHKFITPIEVSDLSTDLLPYASQMASGIGLDIATTAAFDPSITNTVYLVANAPHAQPIENGKLIVEFSDENGNNVARQVQTTTFQMGPNIVPVTFNTSAFNPPYQPGHDYTLLGFFTDSQGNIIETRGRRLLTFADDPDPILNTAPDTWNFGSVVQGAQPQRTISIVNTGLMPLNAVVSSPTSTLTLLGASGIISVPPAGSRDVIATLDTTNLTGTIALSLTIRSNDTANQTRTLYVTGTIVGPSSQANAFDLTDRPWDKRVRVFGNVSANTLITFTQNIQPDPGSIEPCKVYDASGEVLKGVGKFCSGYSSGSISYQQLFGDGADGSFTVVSNQTMTSTYYTALTESVSAGATLVNIANSSAFAQNTEILIHQTQGVGAGTWESNTVVSVVGTTLNLLRPLSISYNQGGSNRAQVIRIPHYTNVTVQSGATLTAPAWNGSTGGILIFRASGTVAINGSIDMTGKGFRGGSVGNNTTQGFSGEGTTGPSVRQQSANGSGGGTGALKAGRTGGGGGGGHATTGTNGTPSSEGGDNGLGGNMSGTANLNTLTFGGGGGAGGQSDENYVSGAGGAGGGIIFIAGSNVSLPGIITTNGSAGQAAQAGVDSAGGGGGAAGSVLIKSQTADLGNNRIPVTGGPGGGGSTFGREGGGGAVGRIHVEYCTSLSGSNNPPANTQQLSCYLADTSGLSASQLFGNGSDGSFNVTSNQTMTNTYYTVLNASVSVGTSSLSVANASAFAQNTEILIHQSQGVGAGTWESNTVVSTVGSTLNLSRPLVNGYNQGGNNHAQVIRIPHYTNVNVQSGATLFAPAWNGSTGGILAFRANGTITVAGTINVTGLGFAGGASTTAQGPTGFQGEGMTGGSGTRSTAPNGNGGGGGGGDPGSPDLIAGNGGGGGNGSAGSSGGNGPPGHGTYATQGAGGNSASSSDLTTFVFGGGGGAGGNDTGGSGSTPSGGGGNGGGIIFLSGVNITISGSIISQGGIGGNSSGPSGAGGGGAGGAILLKAQTATLGSDLITALEGGPGANVGGFNGIGGFGSTGRIRVEYCDSISGGTNPPASTQQLNCFLAQGYGGSIVSFTVPDNVTNGRDYKMQFGRHYSFSSAGSIVIPSRVLSQTFELATMDVLITPAGVGGTTNLNVLVGNQTVLSTTQSITQPTTISIPNFAGALNQYIASQPSALTVDVPFAVTIDRQADVMLTNLSLIPASGVDLAVGAGDLQIGCPGGPGCLATEGNVITPTVQVRNIGAQTASSAVVGYYAGDPRAGGRLLGNSYVETIAPGGAVTASFGWNTQGFTGSQTLYVSVDPSNSISETLETNNIISQTLYIKTKPELQVGSIGLSSIDRVSGEPITATLVISNSGETNAGLSTTRMNALGQRGDAFIQDLPTGGVVATGTVALSTVFTPTLFGFHTITATADVSTTVVESIETNNVLTRTIFVGLPAQEIDSGGGSSDPPYTSTIGYGYLNGESFDFGGDPIIGTVRFDGSGVVQYQFEGLQPTRSYHLDGIYYQEGDTFTQKVEFDGVDSGQTIQLTSGVPVSTTMLVPSSAYADTTMTVTVRRPSSGPAFVSELALVPIEYTYIDSGSPADLAYNATRGYGYLGTNTFASTLDGSDPLNSYRTSFGNTVVYQFDSLSPTKNYMADLTMYDGAGSGRRQSVRIDGNPVSGCTNLPVNSAQRVQCAIDPTYYAGDRSVQVTVFCDSCTGPRVSEIALEQKTRSVIISGPIPTPTATSTPQGTSTPTATATSTVRTIVSAFAAQWSGNMVQVTWATTEEHRTDLFELWRSPSINPASWALVNSQASQSNCADWYTPSSYGFTDNTVVVGQTYYYRLTWRGDNCGGQVGQYLNSATALPPSLIGHVEWQGRGQQPDARQQVPVTLTLRLGTSVYTYPNITTDATGHFTATVATLSNGNYNWWVKGPQHLANGGTVSLTGDIATQSEMGLMRAGDADYNNIVDITDFSLLRATFGKSQGEPGYNPQADFNGDSTIDITDFTLLRGNFGQSGAPPLSPTNPQGERPVPSGTGTPTATIPVVGGDAYLELRPQGGTDVLGGSNKAVKVGDKVVFDLWVHGGKSKDLVGQSSYLTFNNSLLQNVEVRSLNSCVASNTITSDLSVFDVTLQSEVCNGSMPCAFRGLKVPPGSIAFASGAMGSPSAKGAFRVGEIGLCAVAPGQAKISWQLDAAPLDGRGTQLVDEKGKQVGDTKPFTNFTINIVEGKR